MPDPYIKPNEEKCNAKKGEANETKSGTVSPESVKTDPLAQPEEKKMKKEKLKEEPEEEEEKAKKQADEDEEETEKQEGEEQEDEKKKKKMKKESDDKEDEEEKKKAKKKKKKSDDDEEDVEKEEGAGESPEEDAAAGANEADNTITPGANTPSQAQNVFVPPSDVNVDREQDTPMDKSVNPDLLKSPLFMSLSKQMDGIREAVSKKITALEKSVNDRLNNVMKDMGKIEKFYKQGFYKAINENTGPETVKQQTISKQITDGEVRYRNK